LLHGRILNSLTLGLSMGIPDVDMVLHDGDDPALGVMELEAEGMNGLTLFLEGLLHDVDILGRHDDFSGQSASRGAFEDYAVLLGPDLDLGELFGKEEG